MTEKRVLVRIKGVEKHFPQGRKVVRAVDGVSLNIDSGETVGLVGESGCGKSTLGRTILGLYKPTSGSVLFEDKDLFNLPNREMNRLRTDMQIILQDPASSLNPIMTTGDNIKEALIIHDMGTRDERQTEVERLLDEVGIGKQFYWTFPYELSIGQQQRVAIARAIALRPKFIVCDEAVSSLDVSIQAQILSLLLQLQEEYGLAYLFISHDLRVVQFMSHRIAVMYLGRIVELGSSEAVYRRGAHPYTQALLSAVPEIPSDGGVQMERIILAGEPPSPIDPPTGCPFHPRCPNRMNVCSEEVPQMVALGSDHQAACHLYDGGNGSERSI